MSIAGSDPRPAASAAHTDPRYAKLRSYKRRLFPELICPTHDEIGTPAASAKPSEYVWCHGDPTADGHWFTKGAA